MNILIEQIQWPCKLSHSLKTQLIEIATVTHGMNKLAFTRQVAAVPAVYYVQEGIASLCFSSEDINSVNSVVIGPGDWFGGAAIVLDMKLFVSVEEIEPISLICFPKEKVINLAQSNNEVYKWLYYSMRKIQATWLQAQISSLHDRQTRIIYALLDLADRVKSIKGSISTINISQNQLSIVTGISRPRVNEALKSLEKSGEIIIQRGRIYLVDPHALEEKIEKLNLIFTDHGKGSVIL